MFIFAIIFQFFQHEQAIIWNAFDSVFTQQSDTRVRENRMGCSIYKNDLYVIPNKEL